jgi:urease beta subunit
MGVTPYPRHPDGAPPIELAAGHVRRRLAVTNTSRRAIRVSSHFPFHRVNPRLRFDRAAAEGYRLDLPAGGSVRWAPGETHEVDLVSYAKQGGSR